MILLDSDHLSVLIDDRHRQHRQLLDRLDEVTDEMSLPVIVMEEHLRGWLA